MMFDAVVLAGGRARRLGGADKPSLLVGDTTLLDRVLAALAAAHTVVVVGAVRPLAREVTWCVEQPPGGGPVAAIAAGLQHTRAEVVVVLAADLPAIAPAVPQLLSALDAGPADVAVLVDANGRCNYLAAAWRRAALITALDALGALDAAAAHALFGHAKVAYVPDVAGAGTDCDTWEDLAQARRRAKEMETP